MPGEAALTAARGQLHGRGSPKRYRLCARRAYAHGKGTKKGHFFSTYQRAKGTRITYKDPDGAERGRRGGGKSGWEETRAPQAPSALAVLSPTPAMAHNSHSLHQHLRDVYRILREVTDTSKAPKQTASAVPAEERHNHFRNLFAATRPPIDPNFLEAMARLADPGKAAYWRDNTNSAAPSLEEIHHVKSL